MPESSPIGVFDSGIGGLSVLRHMRALLPEEDMVYIGDTAHVPYGNKSEASIKARSEQITRYLIEHHQAKAIVIACNTATAAAVSHLRNIHSQPIIGMEPGVKPAVVSSRTGTVGILATESTLNSEKFSHLVNRFGEQAQVITQHCAGLVDLIEQGEAAINETRSMVDAYLQPLLKQGADTIVLGCTHYPLIAPMIRELAGEAVEIIETGDAVARQLKNQLQIHQLSNSLSRSGSTRFYATAYNEMIHKKFDQIWRQATQLEALVL